MSWQEYVGAADAEVGARGNQKSVGLEGTAERTKYVLYVLNVSPRALPGLPIALRVCWRQWGRVGA